MAKVGIQTDEKDDDEFWQSVDYEAIQVRDGQGNLVAW